MVYNPPPAADHVVVEPIAIEELLVANIADNKVFFGPELPPVMALRREFEILLQSDFNFQLTKPVEMLPVRSSMLTKRSGIWLLRCQELPIKHLCRSRGLWQGHFFLLWNLLTQRKYSLRLLLLQ